MTPHEDAAPGPSSAPSPAAEGEGLVAAAMDCLPIPVIIVGADGTIRAVNDRLVQQFGYSREELRGQQADVVLPEGPLLRHAALRRDGTPDVPHPIDPAAAAIALRKDGSRVPVSISVTWLASSTAPVAVAALVDATERDSLIRQFYEALDRAIRFERLVAELTAGFVDLQPQQVDGALERALRLLVEALDLDRCFIFMFDESGQEFVLTHVARRGDDTALPPARVETKDFPWSTEKIRRGEVAIFSSIAEVPDAVEQATLQRFGTLSRVAFPLSIRGRVAGGMSFVVTRQARWWSPELLGRLGLVTHVVSGVLARRNADNALQSSELRFRMLADNAPVMIWMSGADKLCTWFNRQWVQFVGRRLEDDLGDGWVDNVHPDDRKESLRVYSACFGARQPFTIECRLRRHDGEWRWVLYSGAPNHGVDGTFEGYVGSWVEVTEQKRAVQRAEQSRDHLHAENVYLRREADDLRGAGPAVGRSPAIQRVLQMIDHVAPTDSTILLLGETGTGKEFLAARIHELSTRRTRSMVRVNCAAIPGTLIESELFGRERGAFTGAVTRQVGRFELADRSTIFLDEIGDLPVDVQVTLLRVLEERQFERLGSSTPIRVDARIIAATHRNLEQRIADGTFREDLFYRLNVFPITVPPLRERVDDIPGLVWHFVDQFSASLQRRFDSIPADDMAALQRYGWPGNIRELRNVVERAMILATGARLRIPLPETPAASGSSRERATSARLVDIEREHIRRVLDTTAWRIRGAGGAADRLGLAPTTLESRMRKLGLSRRHGSP
jgi:formate hydrogenlyase transcriptional activator